MHKRKHASRAEKEKENQINQKSKIEDRKKATLLEAQNDPNLSNSGNEI